METEKIWKNNFESDGEPFPPYLTRVGVSPP